MRERVINCDKFEFISIIDVIGLKAVNEHASFFIKGHIAAETDEYVLRNSEGQSVNFTVTDHEGVKQIFGGIINNIDIYNENELRILTLDVVSNSTQMDIYPETRTFQDSNITYQTVTSRMAEKQYNHNYLWPSDGERPIGSMTVQYNETDWQYSKRLAGRLGTVVVPDYLLDVPYISIGMPKRPAKQGIDTGSYSIHKDVQSYRDSNAEGISERDSIYYIVKSREIFDLCDPVPFLGKTLFVYAIDTKYEGQQLVHYYTLKEKSGFFTPQTFNENINGVSLGGTVIEIHEDKVRVDVYGDVSQTAYKWFPYATPFTQPDGYGWYFMPEVGDEIRLQFPSAKEHDAYVSSGVHVSHGHRHNPDVKFIRTIYGQVIQFDPMQIMIDDGAGSRLRMHVEEGISLETDKTATISAASDITLVADGKVLLTGHNGVAIQKGDSVLNINDAIDASADHTRVQ